ncbi:MAG: ADP-ribosylglycohydrolase family protein [Eubacterium sp.]|nr:ADP-ribosylglycohydrolase family protein [Eubacterium sp.]
MNFYDSPYQNLDKALPAEVDYFSVCYPDYDEGPCTLSISGRIECVQTGLKAFPDMQLLSQAVQDATEKILKEWIVDETSMIQVYGAYLSRCLKEHPEAAFGRRFAAWGRETAGQGTGGQGTGGQRTTACSANAGPDRIRYSVSGQARYNISAGTSNEAPHPYGSCGSGSAVRAGIIGAMHEDIDVVMTLARASAMPTHNHPAGIRGAMVTAVLVWMALHGADKQEIEHYLLWNYPNSFLIPGNFDIQEMPEGMKDELCPPDIHGGTSLRELMLYGEQNETYGKLCQYTVPEAVINFLYSDSVESCMKNAEKYPCDEVSVKAISAQVAAAWYRTK